MKVGDIVVPNLSVRDPLTSGCSYYSFAICASVEPFVLISERGDMCWSATVKEQDFQALCKADEAILKVVMKRFQREVELGNIILTKSETPLTFPE